MRYVVYYCSMFGRARYKDNLTADEAMEARNELMRQGYKDIEIEEWN